MKVMEDAGKPMADGLGITLCLVDMLPTIPLQLAFNTATPGLTGFAPKVYAAQPKSRMDLLDFSTCHHLQSDQNVMTVLHEEIIKNAHGMTEEKAIQPTWLMSMANVSTISVKAAETGGSDGPTSSPHMSHSPVVHASHSPVLPHASPSPVPHVTHSLVPHSPLKSPSLGHHSQSSRLSSSSSGSSSGSGSASGSSSSGSSESGSGDESGAGSPAGSQAPSEGSSSSGSECSHSTSPEVVLVQGDDEDAAGDEEDEGHSDDEEALSQGTVSLLDISNSDNEEARKATAAHEKACKSDVQFAAW